MQQTQKTPGLEELVGALLTAFGSKENELNWSACDEILVQISKHTTNNLGIEASRELFWKIHTVLSQCVLFS